MTTAAAPLKCPYPYPGGKSRVADTVWARLGNVDNYVEPFAGSLAVLLRRPADHFRDGYRVETCNDLNHYLVNFWRCLEKQGYEQLARWCDWPVTEADLHARHKWLVRSREAAEWRTRFSEDPHYCDEKIAGWWVWGQCCWIGGAWCVDQPGHRPEDGQRPQLSHESGTVAQIPELASGMGRGQPAAHPGSSHKLKLPELAQKNETGARGVCSPHGRPQLADAYDIGRGVNGHATAGTCDARREWLVAWMKRLADRLRLVRTCYGHWSRVCDSESTLTRLGTTGVFLDPPYPAKRGDTGAKSRDDNLYANDKRQDLNKLRDEVLAWCRRWGTDPRIRVAVCGYEGDGYEPLESDGWTVFAWEANGGYANQQRKGQGKAANARRERIWFNPACLTPDKPTDLFASVEDHP